MPQIWQASNTMPIFGQHKRRKSEKKKQQKNPQNVEQKLGYNKYRS